MKDLIMNKFSKIMSLVSVIVLVSTCVTTKDAPIFVPYESNHKERKAEDFQATAMKGMVAAAHPLATEAGQAMLVAGGNAIDAAVAASFVISVVRPQSTGIGGGGFMLVHDQANKHQRIFDFRERAPRMAHATMYLDEKGEYKHVYYMGQPVHIKDQKDPDDNVKTPSINGHMSVAIPGLVKGLLEIHQEQGKLPLKDVMAPAIKAAENGFKVYDQLAHAIEERKHWLSIYPASKKLFFTHSGPLKIGDTLIQKDLAETLKIISIKGSKEFYEGGIARKIAAEMQKGGGIIDMADMRSYRMIERSPVKGSYRGHRIVSMPPPSSGGTHIIEMLNMLETQDLSKLHPRGATYLHFLTEVMRRAFADRAKEMGDPDFVNVPVARLTSKTYARDLLKSFDSQKATDSQSLGKFQPSGESPSTTHISVVDQWGNAVATTQTINYSFGSCVVAEGTGIVLNDEMDDFTSRPGGGNVFGLVTGSKNEIAARKTPLSSMSPTMVFDGKGELMLVLGSPGGPKIISAVLQTILNVIDFKMNLLEAVHGSRVHHQYLPDQLRVESTSLDPDSKERLMTMGHSIKPTEVIGDIQAIHKSSEGKLTGVSDIRSNGKPMGVGPQ